MNRMDPMAFKLWLEERTKKFAVDAFKLLDSLPKNNSSKVIAYQLGKSASSVGANYREANRAESADDFKHKLSISIKEASESAYWFEILQVMVPNDASIDRLSKECIEIRNLF